MASGIYYCPTCGYEIRGRGGRCHNCKELLYESPLEELAEGEAEDEVGYNLDEWEDSARGELIEAMISAGFRHRFEGDELVIAADDEDDVDALIAHLGTPGSDAEPDDPVPGQVLTALYDAARRLVVDPTDMIADGDIAESSARLFAIESVWGVEEDTWAAIGRVTRRLLGALGAEEALEGEISESAQLLTVLLDGLKRKVRGFPAPAPVEGDDTDEYDDGDEDDEVELASGDEDEMVYELDDWRPEERAQISVLLDRNKIIHKWEGTDLIVGASHDEAVEGILAEVNRAGSESVDDEDDESRYMKLSDLFAAADRLAGDPEDEDRQAELVGLAKLIQGWATPFGVGDDQWWKVRLRAHDLAESIDLGASRMVLVDSASNLRELLRQFV